jgi:hypothetical protein
MPVTEDWARCGSPSFALSSDSESWSSSKAMSLMSDNPPTLLEPVESDWPDLLALHSFSGEVLQASASIASMSMLNNCKEANTVSQHAKSKMAIVDLQGSACRSVYKACNTGMAMLQSPSIVQCAGDANAGMPTSAHRHADAGMQVLAQVALLRRILFTGGENRRQVIASVDLLHLCRPRALAQYQLMHTLKGSSSRSESSSFKPPAAQRLAY